MLRPHPSRIHLTKSDVDQLIHRLDTKELNNVSKVDWAKVVANRSQNAQPRPPVVLCRGPQRSVDDVFVHSDEASHIASSASSYDASDSEESEGPTDQRPLPPARPSPHLEGLSRRTPVFVSNDARSDGASPLSDQSFLSRTAAQPQQPDPRGTRNTTEIVPRHPVNLQRQALSFMPGRTMRQAENDRLIKKTVGRSHSVEATFYVSDFVSLDPLAPAFVPRVRYGAVSRARQMPYSDQLSSTRSQAVDYEIEVARLRLRTASSRKFDHGQEHDHLPSSPATSRLRAVPSVQSRLGSQGYPAAKPGYRNNGNNMPNMRCFPPQPSARTLAGPVLDRYPVLMPTMLPPPDRKVSCRQTEVVPSTKEPSEMMISRLSDFSDPCHELRPNIPLRLSPPTLSAEKRPAHTKFDASHRVFVRPASSRASTPSSSLSVPNLNNSSFLMHPPLVHSRRSSLDWKKSHYTPTTNLGTGNSIENDENCSSQFSASRYPESGTSAPLFTHQSPLDRLGHELQRLRASSISSTVSASSDRSTGTTTSRQTRLLSGSLFYDEPLQTPTTPSTVGPESTPSHGPLSLDEVMYSINSGRSDSCLDDLRNHNYQRLRNSMSLSPLTQNERKLSKTSSSSPLARLAGEPCLRTQRSIPSTPQHPSLRTPENDRTARSQIRPHTISRVRVYDDLRPANLQPQTPADLQRHSRIAGYHSQGPARPGTRRGTDAMFSPVRLPMTVPRHVHRNTFPFSGQNSASPVATRAVIRGDHAIAQHPTRVWRQDRSSEQENKIDARALGLEADRQIWMRRRAESNAPTMDATPPREGRFEHLMRH